MRVQRVSSPDIAEQSWTVVGSDRLPVLPVEAFLAHLTDQRRSPNTVKAYAHDLRDYFEYLLIRDLVWDLEAYSKGILEFIPGFDPNSTGGGKKFSRKFLAKAACRIGRRPE